MPQAWQAAEKSGMRKLQHGHWPGRLKRLDGLEERLRAGHRVGRQCFPQYGKTGLCARVAACRQGAAAGFWPGQQRQALVGVAWTNRWTGMEALPFATAGLSGCFFVVRGGCLPRHGQTAHGECVFAVRFAASPLACCADGLVAPVLRIFRFDALFCFCFCFCFLLVRLLACLLACLLAYLFV